ncbi:L,D-transpeptidase family protein [Paenibacillus sp. y28]|uniref:L,D-transpeptidase family protein n=1 Tax=Paenibacillus sp. y28 TaxID=3129110 RepID=UPI00301A7C27
MDGTNWRRSHYLKSKLNRVKSNLYIHPSDPQYYEKVIRFVDPHSPEAHYRVGEKLLQQGNKQKAAIHFQEAAKHPSPFNYMARKELIRMQPQPVQPVSLERYAASKRASRSAAAADESARRQLSGRQMVPFILMLAVFAVLIVYLLQSPHFNRTVVSKAGLSEVGRNVVYETTELPYVIYFEEGEDKAQIEKTLHQKALDLSAGYPDRKLMIYGLRTQDKSLLHKAQPMNGEKWKDLAFVVVNYFPAVDKAVNIRFLDRSQVISLGEEEGGGAGGRRLLVYAVNSVRTALAQYMADYGRPPARIEDLVRPYPDNYLSFLPREPLTGSLEVSGQWDGRGGWVYRPERTTPETMFIPNVKLEQEIGFAPVELIIGKAEHVLLLESGGVIVARMPVGLGEQDGTPEGRFSVDTRVRKPQGRQQGSYGAAALGFGSYAVHGTADESSIGVNASLGCVRLLNTDMRSLYPLVPRGAQIHITRSLSPAYGQQEPLLAPAALGGLIPPGLAEEPERGDGQHFYWLG